MTSNGRDSMYTNHITGLRTRFSWGCRPEPKWVETGGNSPRSPTSPSFCQVFQAPLCRTGFSRLSAPIQCDAGCSSFTSSLPCAQIKANPTSLKFAQLWSWSYCFHYSINQSCWDEDRQGFERIAMVVWAPNHCIPMHLFSEKITSINPRMPVCLRP